jgi:hypothetical protein
MTSTTGDPDKNWIACDNAPTSLFYGDCYTGWDNASDGNRIKMQTSTNGGLTRGMARNTGDNATGIGGQPLVRPNGTVLVPMNNANQSQIRSFRSVDGGASWRATVLVPSVSRHTVAGGLRTSPLPSAYYPTAACCSSTCQLNVAYVSSANGGPSRSAPTNVDSWVRP